MNLRISRSGALALAAAVIVATLLFGFMLSRFGGPTVRLSEPYRVSAVVDDTRGLVTRSDVLVRGVDVGEVESVAPAANGARITLALDESVAPVRRDATVRVGAKTLFGESYVDLDPGSRAAAALDSGNALAEAAVLPAAVDVDEALDALDSGTRDDLDAVLRAVGDGARSPLTGERVSATLAELTRATHELRGLVETLEGQETTIANGVDDAGNLLATLATESETLRGIVVDGEAALSALAGADEPLRAGLDELPRLVSATRQTLAGLRPLIAEADPLATKLALAAPELRAALADLPPAAADADRLLAGVPELERVGVPFLERARTVLGLAEPVAGPFSNAVRNLQPIADFLSQRREAFAAWFSNTADLGSHRDAKGYFARFFVGFEPSTALGVPGGNYETNAYTGPGDAADPQPYSGYPRLEPFDPYDDGDQ